MARKSTKGRKLGLFIGGVMYALVRGIFFNKYCPWTKEKILKEYNPLKNKTASSN